MNPKDLPWLLRPSAFTKPGEFNSRTIWKLGETASYLEEFWDGEAIKQAIVYARGAPKPEEWASAMGREILLLSRSRRDLAASALSICIEAGLAPLPFASGRPCETFLGGEISATLIPLESTGGADPAFAQLWVLPASLWPEAEARLTERLVEPGNLGVLNRAGFTAVLVTEPSATNRIEGRSWELGAALALKAAQEGNGATALQLAKDWIVTGSVEGRDVLPVGFHAKPRLAKTASCRKWLVPAANQATISPDWEALTAGRLHFARDIQSSWAQVTGEGFQGGGDLYWDKPPLAHPREFHCFASPALGPMLAAFLWSQPERIVIWASEKMKAVAEQLEAACKTLRPTHFRAIQSDLDIDVKKIDDTDLSEIRAVFLDHPLLGRGGPTPVVFNITGGNLLMRVALLDLARLRPHIHMVYRPEGGKALDFSYISHPYLQPVTAKVRHSFPKIPDEQQWLTLLNDRLDPGKLPVGEWAEKLVTNTPLLIKENALPPNRITFSHPA